MRTLYFVAAVCAVFSALLAKADVTSAPSGRYTIEQRYIEPEDNQDVGAWEAILRFSGGSKAEATLAADPDHYIWPAAYIISPDERWVLRLQKTGSGENCALLYRVESNGQVWRLEQHLDDLALAVATAGSHRSRKDYYHITVGLVSWDTAKGLVHLTIDATAEDKAKASIDSKVVYDLRKHKMAAE